MLRWNVILGNKNSAICDYSRVNEHGLSWMLTMAHLWRYFTLQMAMFHIFVSFPWGIFDYMYEESLNPTYQSVVHQKSPHMFGMIDECSEHDTTFCAQISPRISQQIKKKKTQRCRASSSPPAERARPRSVVPAASAVPSLVLREGSPKRRLRAGEITKWWIYHGILTGA